MKQAIPILALSLAFAPPAFAGCNPATLGKRVGKGVFVNLPVIKNKQPLGYLCTRTVTVQGAAYKFDVVAETFYENEIDYCAANPSSTVTIYKPASGGFIAFLRNKGMHLRSCYPATKVDPPTD